MKDHPTSGFLKHRKISGPWLPRITVLDFDPSLDFRQFGKKKFIMKAIRRTFFYHMQKQTVFHCERKSRMSV